MTQVLDFLMSSTGQVIIMTSLLAVMIVLSLLLLKRFRDNTGDDVPTPSEHLTNFQELHDQGDISDAEFRKLKTVLIDKFQQQLNDKGETG
jgi:uncharacterized membrane protein